MRPFAEQHFAAMGTTAHVVVVGPDAQRQLGKATERVFDLEQRWSRFLPTSEVTQLNNAAGAPIEVSGDTLELVEHGVAGWRLTEGRFDPTMVVQLERAGYDRSFELIGNTARSLEVTAAVGCAEVIVDRRRSEVTLPSGLGFDPGGIGKGLAADIVTRELIDDGALGVMVNLGGDLAVQGLPIDGDHWVVTIAEPAVHRGTITKARLRNAGLATSTTAKRRWRGSHGERHHILDPKTGCSTNDKAVLATVIAGAAWWAEVSATSMLATGEIGAHVESSMLMHTDGRVEKYGDFARFES